MSGGAWFDLAHFNKEFLEIAHKAGCRYFDFSPDAVTNEGLKVLGKNFTVKDIERSLDLVRNKKKIFVSYHFFCTYPGQNLKGALKTVGLFFKIIFALFGKVRVYIGWIRILPNTCMHQLAINEGFINKETPLFVKNKKDFKRVFYAKPLFWFVELFFACIFNIFIYVVKPVLKVTFKILHIDYPFYF